MKMSGKWWAVIGVVFLIAALVALYIPYNSNKNEQTDLQQQIALARQMVLARTMSKNTIEQRIQELEADIAAGEEENAQLQEELDQLEEQLLQLEDEREQAIQEAIALLTATEARFLSAAESIEYGELLFAMADTAQITLAQIDYSHGSTVNIEGVDYDTVSLELSVYGKKADILAYLAEIQSDDAFNTSLFDQVNILMPKLLTEDEKDYIFEIVLDEMVATAIADLTPDEICNFIVLGIEDVTGDLIIKKTVENMAKEIKMLLNALMAEDFDDPLVSTLKGDYDDLLAQKLAELIKQHINDWLEDTVVNMLAERIAIALQNGDDLEGIVGKDIAALLGTQLSGALASDIAALLKEYISERIYDRMVGYVTPHIYTDAQEASDELITILETYSSSYINIAVYVYNTSQEAE